VPSSEDYLRHFLFYTKIEVIASGNLIDFSDVIGRKAVGESTFRRSTSDNFKEYVNLVILKSLDLEEEIT